MKIYNYELQFCDSSSQEVESRDSSRIISIQKDNFIDHLSLSASLIYQNNQDRQISLLTNHDFTMPDDNQPWIFYVEDVISFAWKTKSSTIRYRYHNLATDEIFRFWLYHVVLPIYFSISQKYRFLHAGAVEIDKKTVLFMAPSFGGKSTLTDYFIQKGHALVTDDKMATYESKGKYYAVPSHPYHRPFRTVETLGHICQNPATKMRPIHAIYMLEKAQADGEIRIRQLKGVEKFSHLHKGGEMNFSFFTPQYVAYLAALANSVSVFSITVPHSLERLEEVYMMIKEHANTIEGQKNDRCT